MGTCGEGGFSLLLYVVLYIVLYVVTLCLCFTLNCPLDSTGLKYPFIHVFFLFHQTCTIVLGDPRLVDSADVELRIWRADYKVYSQFLTVRGLVPLTLVLFKGEL